MKQEFYSLFAEKINSKLKEEKENKDNKEEEMEILKIDQKDLNKGKIERITKDETKEVGKINNQVFFNYFS